MTATVTHRFEAVQGNVLRWFTSKVDTLNKVAAKIGNGGFTVTVEALPVKSYTEQQERLDRWRFEYGGRGTPPWVGPTYNVTVTGTLPVIPGGWTVVAAVDHFTQEDGTYRNVVRSFEEGAVTDWMSASPDCAHCGRNAARKYTVVVKNEDGHVEQVGKSCLVDYVGHNDIDQLMNLATCWGDLFAGADEDEEDDEYYSSSKGTGYPTVYSVALALAATKAFGYQKAGSDNPTRFTVDRLLQRRDRSNEAIQKLAAAAVEDLGGWGVVTADAEAAIAWAAGYEGYNDYLTNLRTVVTAASGGAEFTSPKHIGLLVSLAPTWNREQERKVERKVRDDAEAARRADAEDAPQGRVEVEGVIVGLKTNESDFGATEKMTVLADGGYKVWVSVPKALEAVYGNYSEHGHYDLLTMGATVGDRVRFTATFEQAEGDSTFAFGKRPASATFVERAEAVVKETEAFMAVRAEQDKVTA